MANVIDISGQKFNKLTVINREGTAKNRQSLWLCRCECGNEIIATKSNLVNGKTSSCGCLRKEKASQINVKHGLRHTRLYRIWLNMKNRCSNPKCKDYSNYGGRGIYVCSEWKNDFEAFYSWAISNGYSDELSIDRINNNGIYCPTNCRWATIKEQNNNRRKRKIKKTSANDKAI